MRSPDSFCLLQEPWQGSPVFRIQEVATPSKQATDTHRILGCLVATHGAIAFFNPPADGTLTGIVGAIERFPLGVLSRCGSASSDARDSSGREIRVVDDTPNSGALLLAAARLADSAGASLPVQEPAPVVDS